MEKCKSCGRNLYKLRKSMKISETGTPLHHKFSKPPEPIGDKIFDEFMVDLCCRIALTTSISDKEFSKLVN